MFETLNDFIAINDILFSSMITVYRLIIDNELSLYAISILKTKLKKNNVILMSKSQITLNFLNLMIAHNELSFFEF